MGGWTPYFVEGYEPALMHEAMASTLDTAVEQIRKIQQDARVNGSLARPRWPMIVLSSPKGWTGPKAVDGLPVEGIAAPGADEKSRSSSCRSVPAFTPFRRTNYQFMVAELR